MKRSIIRALAKDDSGAAAAEYALILAVVGGGIVLAAIGLGAAIGGAMDEAKVNIETCGGIC